MSRNYNVMGILLTISFKHDRIVNDNQQNAAYASCYNCQRCSVSLYFIARSKLIYTPHKENNRGNHKYQ